MIYNNFLSGIQVVSYLRTLFTEHDNFFVNLETTRNSQGPIFILKVSFSLINMHYKLNILILIDIFIHSHAHSFVRSFNPVNHLSQCPSFLPLSNPPPILVLTPCSPINTPWRQLCDISIDRLLPLSPRYLIADTQHNIPHLSSYILVESRA